MLLWTQSTESSSGRIRPVAEPPYTSACRNTGRCLFQRLQNRRLKRPYGLIIIFAVFHTEQIQLLKLLKQSDGYLRRKPDKIHQRRTQRVLRFLYPSRNHALKAQMDFFPVNKRACRSYNSLLNEIEIPRQWRGISPVIRQLATV